MRHKPVDPCRVLILCSLLAGGLLLSGCPAEPPMRTVAEARAPALASAKGRIDIEGGLMRLAAQREGVVARVLVEEGERVQAGQLLAALEEEQPRRAAALAQAETAKALRALVPAQLRVEAGEREVSRLLPLASDASVPGQELDQARDQLAQARAELLLAEAAVQVAVARERLAEHETEQRRVRAPMDGQIVRRSARPGDGVSVATVTPLFVFAPDAPLIVRAELEERWLGRVKPGQAAEVVLEADETQRHAAKVLRVAPVVGQRTPGDDPAERQDKRVAEVVLALTVQGSQPPRIGQRVIVRFGVGEQR